MVPNDGGVQISQIPGIVTAHVSTYTSVLKTKTFSRCIEVSTESTPNTFCEDNDLGTVHNEDV